MRGFGGLFVRIWSSVGNVAELLSCVRMLFCKDLVRPVNLHSILSPDRSCLYLNKSSDKNQVKQTENILLLVKIKSLMLVFYDRHSLIDYYAGQFGSS